MNEIIKEIIEKFPNNSWLGSKLAELDSEITDLESDRNRLVSELSKAKMTINRLRGGLE